MSDAPEPQPSQDSELGVTFAAAPERARDERGEPKMHTPTPEESVRDSESSKKAGVFDVGKAFEAKHELGTIVTDKRKQKAPLSEKLQSAFTEWWGGVQKSAAPVITNIAVPKKKNVEAKVAKAETRAAVIETAATHAAIAPKDDHAVVIEKVKTFKRDVERVTGAPFTVKEPPKKPEDAAPRWTHTVDPETPKEQTSAPSKPKDLPDLRTSMVAPVVEKRIERDITDFYKKPEKKPATAPRKSTVANQIAYMHIPGTVEKRADAPVFKKAATAPVVHTSPVKTSEAVTPTEELRPRETIGYVAKIPKETPEKPLRQGPVSGLPIPETPPQERVLPREESAFRAETQIETPPPRPRTVSRPTAPQPSLFSQKTQAMLWAGIPGVLFVSVMVILVLVMNRGETPEGDIVRETVAVAPEEKLIAVDAQQPIPFTERRAFLDSLHQAVSGASGNVVQFYPVITDESGERTLGGREFFGLLGINLPESTIRTLDDSFVLGSIGGGKRAFFVVLSSSSFDALFSGMLAWEPSLRRDFMPLFDDVYVENELFVDGVRNNRAVRILYGALGEEALVYTFVGKNTVVITTSTETLARIIEEM